MRVRTKLAAVAAVAILASGVGVTSAQAASSDCPTNAMCWWDGRPSSGVPTQMILGTPSRGTYVNIRDNVMSSGYNRMPSPNGDRWCGLNQNDVVTSTTVARFYYGTVVNLGASANNKIDDLLYALC